MVNDPVKRTTVLRSIVEAAENHCHTHNRNNEIVLYVGYKTSYW